LDHKIAILESACKQAVPPEALPDEIFKSIGACALRDIGGAYYVYYEVVKKETKEEERMKNNQLLFFVL
jgi:hypothetical protein